jgi:hypothetical protein
MATGHTVIMATAIGLIMVMAIEATAGAISQEHTNLLGVKWEPVFDFPPCHRTSP